MAGPLFLLPRSGESDAVFVEIFLFLALVGFGALIQAAVVAALVDEFVKRRD